MVVRIETEAESDSSGNRNSYECKTIDENAEDMGNVGSTLDLVDEREGSTIGISDASMGNDSVAIIKEVDGIELPQIQNEIWIPELSLSQHERSILNTRSAFISVI